MCLCMRQLELIVSYCILLDPTIHYIIHAGLYVVCVYGEKCAYALHTKCNCSNF